MQNRGRIVLRGMGAILGFTMIFGSCSRDCDEVAYDQQVCQQSGEILVSVPSSLRICQPITLWTGGGRLIKDSPVSQDDRNILVLSSTYCSEGGTNYRVTISLPRKTGAATYALPSPEIGVYAYFGDSSVSGSPYFATDGTLKVVLGTVTVNSSTNYGADANVANFGVDADVDIGLLADSGEEFSIVGHVTESGCTLHHMSYCEAW